MKKVLLVSISAPPKTGAESIQTARYIKHLGNYFDIGLLTSKASHTGWRKVDPSLEKYTKYVNKNIEIPTFSNKISGLSRYKVFPSTFLFPDTDFLFHILGLMSLKEIRSLKADIIYSRSTPISSAILAYKLKKRLKIPWVMHLSDPWVGNPYYNWSIASKKKCARFERLLFDSADIITLTSETAVKLYIEKYPHRKHDILYYPNVYDEINKKSLDIDIDKKIRITYTGNIYKQRGIYPLIQAVEYIKSNHPDYTNALEVKIAGNIDDENLNLLERSDHKNITYLGHLNYSDSTDLINSSHILVTIDKPLENEFDNTFLPSKIMDYLASNRIILGITHKGSPTYKLVHNRFGKCFPHSEVSQISKFIIDVINSYRKNLMTNFKPEKEIDFFSAEYQSKILKKTFEKLIT